MALFELPGDDVPPPPPVRLAAVRPGAGSNGPASGDGAASGSAADDAASDLAACVPAHLRRGGIRGRATRDALPRITLLQRDPVRSAVLQEVWDAAAEQGPALGRLLRALAELRSPDADDADTDADVYAEAAAAALRTTVAKAEYSIRDAHHAEHDLPVLLGLLEEGTLPSAWITMIMTRSRSLTSRSRRVLDAIIPGWDMRLSADTFSSWLSRLITWLEEREAEETDPRPVERSVRLPPLPRGLAMLQVVGPIPEVAQTSRRLDLTARAIRDAQRAALRDGTEIPYDIDGSVAASGTPMRLSALRYLLLTRAELDAGDVPVPQDRFRMNVTVPALTLIGESDAPGLLDGTTPIPADLARHLAGGCGTWYRILTDPSSGAFLALQAAGLLDPSRLHGPGIAADGTHYPGATRWRIGTEADPLSACDEFDDVDLVGALAAVALAQHYEDHPEQMCTPYCHPLDAAITPRTPPRRPPDDDPPDRDPLEHVVDTRLARALSPEPEPDHADDASAPAMDPDELYGDPPF